jgi:hypothetical protein
MFGPEIINNILFFLEIFLGLKILKALKLSHEASDVQFFFIIVDKP